MYSSITKFRGKSAGRIFFSRLILSAILISFITMGCMAPRSVRNGRTYKKTAPVETEKKEVTLKNLSDEEIKEAQDQLLAELGQPVSDENRLVSSDINNQDNQTTESTSRKIPTLREQMRMVKQDQELMNHKVSDLQDEVSDIKETLEYIKEELKYMNSGEKREAVAGEYLGDQYYERDDNTESEVYDEEDADDNSDLILSDEAVTKKKAVKAKSSVKKTARKKTASVKKSSTPRKTKTNKSNKTAAVSNTAKTSTTSSPSTASGGFKSAMKSFTQKNYHKAISELSNIANKDGDNSTVSKCNYWIGESHFGLNQYDKAIGYFQKVLKSGDSGKKDDAMIMIAESHVRNGKVKEAKKVFNNFIHLYPKSQYVARAKKMLQQL